MQLFLQFFYVTAYFNNQANFQSYYWLQAVIIKENSTVTLYEQIC